MDTTPTSNPMSSKPSSSRYEGFKHMFEGIHFQYPAFKHDHPKIIDVNTVADEQLTFGDRIADKVAATVGSWPFIIVQSTILLLWIAANVVFFAFARRLAWDPYPFILLNLALSFQAAYAAPFVMMSQNRQVAKDRLMAENDYKTDCKGEQEICYIMEHLNHQDKVLQQLLEQMEIHHQALLLRLSKLDPEAAKQLVSDIDQLTGEEAES